MSHRHSRFFGPSLRPLARAFALTCALLGLGLAVPSYAQHGAMGGGQGQPAPFSPTKLDKSLPLGTVSIHVVQGSLDKPLADIEVSLVSGEDRVVLTTDAEGRAVFSEVAPASYEANAKIGSSGVLKSETFAIPKSGGVSIVLSTQPLVDRGGRPSSRFMSGRARPQEGDAPGSITVRAVQGELEQDQFGAGLTADIPDGAVVHLVGVDSEGKMHVESKTVKKADQGRVTFSGLRRDNSLAYYALTVFEREGGFDRLMTQALDLPPMVGSRMMFAGAANDSASSIDDLEKLAGIDGEMPEAGVVEVVAFAHESQKAAYDNATSVELIAHNGKKSWTATLVDREPTAISVIGEAGSMKTLPDTKPGQVSFYAIRPSTETPVQNLEIHIRPKGTDGEDTAVVTTSESGRAYADGLEAGVEYEAYATLFGRTITSSAFQTKADAGVSVAFAFQWKDDLGKVARFEGLPKNSDAIYMARVFSDGREFLTLPFQLTKSRGATVGLYMYPEIVFNLGAFSSLEDERMWFQARFTVLNLGIAPYKTEGSGMLIPLPKGFVGASVDEKMASRVGVKNGEGFLWRGAVPPGQRDFMGSFALPVEDGKATFDMALPIGINGGRFVLEDPPGMELRTPPGAKVEPSTSQQGHGPMAGSNLKYLEMTDITIAPGQRLVFGFRGLPQYPASARYLRMAVGGLVVALVLWAAFVIFFRSKGELDPVLAKLEATRESLMEELVSLERKKRHAEGDDSAKSYEKKRDRLNTRLQAIYREIDEHKNAPRPS